MTYDDERFIDLDSGRRGGGGGGRRGWGGTSGERAHAARGLPAAVFKISSYSNSGAGVWSRFEYISREDEIEMEGPRGERFGLEELEQKLEAWECDGREEDGAQRLAMSAFVSFPRGVDEEKATEAAREFFQEAFADNHDYVWAAHRDTDHFHVHVVVQTAGLDGDQLRIGRADIEDLRCRFAECARAQGIELDAAPRWARGEEKARAAAPEIEGMLRRWSQPENELAGEIFPSGARRTQLEALVEVRRDRDPEAAVSPLEYARAAELLAGRAREQEGGAARGREINSAVQLARFGLHQSQEPACPAAEMAAVRRVVEAVDKDVGGQIREVEDEAERRGLWAVRRPLGEELAAIRPAPDRPWAREEAREREGPWNECQALEYAKAAGRAAVEIGELTNDRDRVAAIHGVVEMARFGWGLAGKEQGEEEDRERAREIIDKTERTLRATIHEIEDPRAQKEAIQARQRLYREGVQEYREERQEERAREREQGRDEGWERER